MKNFKEWKKESNQSNYFEQFDINANQFIDLCKKYFSSTLQGNMKTVHEHFNQNLTEAVESSRYSVEVNFRTTVDETLEGFAKICLGYVSAALKNYGFHTKHVFTEKPLRLLVSSRNWDDGEWTGVITWHPEHNSFVISKGFYNKERRTVAVQSSNKSTGKNAADIAKEMHNLIHKLKNDPGRHEEKLKAVPLKRGPKS